MRNKPCSQDNKFFCYKNHLFLGVHSRDTIVNFKRNQTTELLLKFEISV